MRILLVILSLLVTKTIVAQPMEDSVKQVVNELFAAMKKADSSRLMGCFADNAILQTIVTRNGSVEIKSQELKEFARQVASLPQGAADERIQFDAIHVDADLASVWTSYRFFYKGNFSHCGVNSFQLTRQAGSWKIQYLIDTRRKDNCPGDH